MNETLKMHFTLKTRQPITRYKKNKIHKTLKMKPKLTFLFRLFDVGLLFLLTFPFPENGFFQIGYFWMFLFDEFQKHHLGGCSVVFDRYSNLMV